MFDNHFFYADLSSYHPLRDLVFYEKVFDWIFFEQDGYHLAYSGKLAVAGLYETPDFFKKIKMPHFWMSYIRVKNVDKTTSLAKENGGKVELIESRGTSDKFALIRDPQGAGFTVYQGNEIKLMRYPDQANTLIGNELHVSDVSSIIPFYSQLFDWTFQEVDQGSYNIFGRNLEKVATCLVLPNSLKGKYEYWVCTFGVSNLSSTVKKVLKSGGGIISEEDNRVLCHDKSQEAFFYLQQL